MERHDEIISQANELTKARYDFSPTEKNILYHIIKKVRDGHFQTSLMPEIWENMYVYINSSDLSRSADENHTKRALQALKDLRHKDIDIENSEGEIINVGFINYSKYKPRNKAYEVEVSKEILPYLVELAKNFTTYSLTVAISLKSKYTQRFYEFACQYRNKKPSPVFYIDVEDLREMFCLGKGYKSKSDIKRRVIDVAVDELKKAYNENNCDLYLDFWEEKREKTTRFWFKVRTKLQEEKLPDSKVLEKQLITIDRIIRGIFKKDRKFCERIIKALTFEPDKISPIHDRLIRLLDEEVKKGENPGALCRYILKNDFDIV